MKPIAVYILFVLLAYLGVSFIVLQYNPFEWCQDARILFVSSLVPPLGLSPI